ncbi:MAG: metallophosphoesterase [Patescibacteria group bacterium]
MAYLFLFIAIVFLVAAHWLVYDFFARSFSIGSRRGKNILRLIFFLLPIGFIFSSLLVYWQENFLTKIIYFIFSLWPGVLINFLLIIGAVWLITGAVEATGRKMNRRLTGIMVLLVTIIYSGYGVVNAFFPTVKKITVSIDGLPANWQGKTIVQISDLHLGEVLGKNFLERVLNKVNNLRPEAIVITGDLFDGMDGNLDSFVELLDSFKTSEGVYYVTGNHEIYLGIEEVLATLKKTEINILDDEVADINGLQFIGVSYPGIDENKNGKNIINNYNQEKPSILLYHAPVDIFYSSTDKDSSHKDIYLSPNTDFTATKGLGIDLQLSGHTHNGQIFPFNLVTKLIYNGYSNGLYRDGNFSLYTTSGTGVWGPTMRTGSRSEIVLITLK